MRALEVIELTGRPFSATMPERTHRLPTVVVGLRVDRPVLDERLGLRIDRMWEQGLLDVAFVGRRGHGLAGVAALSADAVVRRDLRELRWPRGSVPSATCTTRCTRAC